MGAAISHNDVPFRQFSSKIRLGPCSDYLKVTCTSLKTLREAYDDYDDQLKNDEIDKIYDSDTDAKHIIKAAEYVVYFEKDILISDKWSRAVYSINSEINDGEPELLGHLGKVGARGIAASEAVNIIALVDSGLREDGGTVKMISPKPEFHLLAEWGEKEKNSGLKWRPRGICFDNKGRIIVADAVSGCAIMFSKDGTKLVEFTDKTFHSRDPTYVMVDMFDRIFVSYRDSRLIVVFDEHGERIGVLRDPMQHEARQCGSVWYPWYPRGMCSDMQGNIFVCDSVNQVIHLFDFRGNYITFIIDDTSYGHPFDIAHNKVTHMMVITYHDSISFKSSLKCIVTFSSHVLTQYPLTIEVIKFIKRSKIMDEKSSTHTEKSKSDGADNFLPSEPGTSGPEEGDNLGKSEVNHIHNVLTIKEDTPSEDDSIQMMGVTTDRPTIDEARGSGLAREAPLTKSRVLNSSELLQADEDHANYDAHYKLKPLSEVIIHEPQGSSIIEQELTELENRVDIL